MRIAALPDHIEIVVELDGEVPVVEVSGELDLLAAPAVQHCIEVVRCAGRPVVVDLAAASFVDCSGVTALLRARQTGVDQDSVVVLRRPNGAVRRVLDLTDVAQLFPVGG